MEGKGTEEEGGGGRGEGDAERRGGAEWEGSVQKLSSQTLHESQCN